jgi:hypothetical protein
VHRAAAALLIWMREHVTNRATVVWIALLGAIEFTDVLTTAIGRAKGAIESMPISAAVMNEGGMVLFVVVKLGLVAAVAMAVLLALRWMHSGRPGAGALYAFTLYSIRVATVALAIVSLHNAMLLQSLQAG